MAQESTAEPTPAVPRLVSILLGIAAVFIMLVLMKQFAGIIAPFFLALNLMITVYPLHSWLTKRGTPSWLGAIITMFTVFAILLALVGGMVWSVTQTIKILPNYSDEWYEIYGTVLDFAAKYGLDAQFVGKALQAIDPNQVIGAATSLVSGASGFVSMLTVIIMAIFFMGMDTPGFAPRMSEVAGLRPNAAAALNSFAVGVRKYWLVTTVFGLIVAVLDGIALSILGVPLPIVWAIFSFITNYIPNIGFLIGLIPPAGLALFANGWQTALIVIVIYSLLNFGVQGLIQPRFAGESVGVTPTVSFFSLLLWSSVLGALGSLIALPLTLFFKAILLDMDPKARWAGILGSSAQPTRPSADPALAKKRKTAEKKARQVRPDQS